MKNQLIVRSFCKEYNPARFIFKDANLRMEGGHIYGLVAPSGAGKTTLMKCVAGITNFTGQINYNGVGVGSHFNGQIVHSSSEPPFADSTISVVEYLRFITILKDISFEEALAKFRKIPALSCFENFVCGELSTGQKKIFQLFLDLLSNPKVILLDEPLNGLDRELRQLVFSSLHSLVKQGAIILISTHVFSDIEGLTDKIFILRNRLLDFYENEKNIATIYDKFFPLRNNENLNF